MATWKIETLESNVADGGVTVAHWRVTEQETVGSGDDAVTYTASSYGTVGFTPDADADGFIAYDSLTEANVLDWVYASVNKTEIEASLTADITLQKTPTTINGVPW